MKKTIAVLTFALSAVFAVEPVAAPAKNYSAEDIARAEKMFRAMKIDEQMDQMVENMLAVQMRNNPNRDTLEPIVREFFYKYISYNALKSDLALLYLDIFTPAEIDEITAFYRSPAGMKLSGNMTLIRERGAELTQRKFRENQQEIQQAITAALQKKLQAENTAAEPAPAK